MQTSSFCEQALLALKQQAEAAAKRFPPLHHMLVLPPGESVSIPSYGSTKRSGADNSAHQQGSGHQRPTLRSVTFGQSKIAAIDLPPPTAMPAGLEPLFAVVAERAQTPTYQPLIFRPYRVHLFFGDGAGFPALKSLATSIMGLRNDLIVARGGEVRPVRARPPFYIPNINHFDPLFLSPESLHGWPAAPIIDSWLCTVHWWAWALKRSPIHAKPKVLFNGLVIDASRGDRAVHDRLSFSHVPADVFALSAATIDQLLGLPRGYVSSAFMPKLPTMMPVLSTQGRPSVVQVVVAHSPSAVAVAESPSQPDPAPNPPVQPAAETTDAEVDLEPRIRLAFSQFQAAVTEKPELARAEPSEEAYQVAKAIAVRENDKIAKCGTWLRYVREARKLLGLG